MNSFELISILSKSLSDVSIITLLVHLKNILKSINEEDLKELYEKYPELKRVIHELREKLG